MTRLASEIWTFNDFLVYLFETPFSIDTTHLPAVARVGGLSFVVGDETLVRTEPLSSRQILLSPNA